MSKIAKPTTRLRDHRPEPANLWMRHAAVWPSPEDLLWIDLARGDVGGSKSVRAPGRQFEAPVDLTYLPPAAGEAERRRLGEWCTAHQIPTLLHQVLGDESQSERGSEPYGDLATPVVDPLTALLEERLELLNTAPQAGLVVWPVVAGLTDDSGLVAQGLDRLSDAGVAAVVPVPIVLNPAAGRQLTDRYGDRVFHAVFHGGEIDLRAVARAVREREMEFLPPRPALPGTVPTGRRLATELALIGELATATDESPVRAQEFFRAANWLEETRHDIAALIRDGNLTVVPAISEQVATVMTELAAGTPRSTLLRRLEGRYAGGAARDE